MNKEDPFIEGRSQRLRTSTAFAVETYIESNPDGKFVDESDIAKFVQRLHQGPATPTVRFYWRLVM